MLPATTDNAKGPDASPSPRGAHGVQGAGAIPWRADVDGLRGVAVLAVVLFHGRLIPGGGGFVGVDVFFVVSGWVITSLILRQLEAGEFSIARFYERRVRRLFPALTLMLLCSMGVAAPLLLPTDLVEFAGSVVSTTLFFSNVYFWLRTGYFDSATEMKPLVHTWTLSVEEQFYLVFPLLLRFAHRLGRRAMVALVLGTAIGSFALSVEGVRHHPAAAFYLLPARGWELLLGALAALEVLRPARRRLLRDLGGLIGLALLLYAVFGYSGATPFPGVAALLPCVGALLLVLAGTRRPDDDGPSLVARALANRPLVWVGSISYALYLWHWPMLVLARYLLVHDLSYAERAVVVALSIAVSALSGRLVEQGFRARACPDARAQRRFFAQAFAVATCMIAAGLVGQRRGGWPERLPTQAVQLASSVNDRDEAVDACSARPGSGFPITPPCSFGARVPARTAVWGDSHAEALAHGIAASAERAGQSILYLGTPGCRPVLGVFDSRNRDPFCPAFQAATIEFLRTHPEVDTVIVAGRLVTLAHGSSRALGPVEDDTPPTIAARPGEVLDVAAAEELTRQKIPETIHTLLSMGKRVVLVYPIPEVGYAVPFVTARRAMGGGDPAFTTPRATYDARSRFIAGILDGIDDPRLVRVRPGERLCDARECRTVADERPLYFDGDHLSRAGAEYVSTLFDPVFSPVAK